MRFLLPVPQSIELDLERYRVTPACLPLPESPTLVPTEPSERVAGPRPLPFSSFRRITSTRCRWVTTDDTRCPFHANAAGPWVICYLHGWSYRRWFNRYRSAMARLADPERQASLEEYPWSMGIRGR